MVNRDRRKEGPGKLSSSNNGVMNCQVVLYVSREAENFSLQMMGR